MPRLFRPLVSARQILPHVEPVVSTTFFDRTWCCVVRARAVSGASSPQPTIDRMFDGVYIAPVACFLLLPPPPPPGFQGELANAMARRKSSGVGMGSGGPGRGGAPAVPYSAPAPVGWGGSKSPPPAMPAPMPGRGAPMPGRPGVGAPAVLGKVCVCGRVCVFLLSALLLPSVAQVQAVNKLFPRGLLL